MEWYDHRLYWEAGAWVVEIHQHTIVGAPEVQVTGQTVGGQNLA